MHRTAIWFCSVVLLLVAAYPAARAQAANGQKRNLSQRCAAADPYVPVSNDIEGFKTYGAQLRQLLAQKKFRQLDCIADMDRSSKARGPGGIWKLHEFYWGVSELPGHPTQEDLKNQLRLAQNWVTVRPASITARIVLARSYINYAWDARGTDTGDSVTGSGWKLFRERLEKAKAILDKASTLEAKCPERYLAMQEVALGLGWDRPAAMDLFQKATAFEPEYYYYYRVLASYLMPQWNGADGDAAKFAEESADHVGGDAGDILYFQIGEKIVCACDQPEYNHLSWPRLQKGYELLEKNYGVSVANLNRLAVMATKSEDWSVADSAFQRIGDNWDKEAWITETYFHQVKDLASQIGPRDAQTRALLKEAAANLQSEGGASYQKSIEQALLPFLRQCVKYSNDQAKFEFAVKIGKEGSPEDAFFRVPSSLAQCMGREMYGTHVKKETPFPMPPRPDYWIELYLDPAAANVAAAN